MIKHWLRSLTLAAGMTAAAMNGAHAEDMKTLNFGIISTETSQNLKSIWEPFLADMSKQTGLEVKAFFASDYAGVIQGMRFDKVDVAWYGNKSAMEAVDRAGGEIFAQILSAEGDPGYWSLLITNKDKKNLNSVDDVLKNAKDLTFSNGDPNSTSGYLVPGYYVFAANGVDPQKAFKRTLNANHEANALAVANKQVDVATFNTEVMARLKATNPDKAAQLKILWQSPLIPNDPIAWRKNLPEDVKAKVKSFMLDYGKDAREKKILADMLWAGFKESSNDQLIPIRQLALFKDKTSIENNEGLSADEKAKKIADINAQLKDLEQRAAAISKQQASVQ